MLQIPIKNNITNIIKTGSKYKFGLLLFYPLLYLFIGIYFRILIGDLSLVSVDPDYVYFLSGVTISEGYFKVGHIDHPGTPLQYLIAVVLKVIYLFRKDANVTFIQDVFANSDLYLSVVNVILTFLVVISIFIAGKYVWRKTGSVLYGVLIQTIPFVQFVWYEMIGRIMPELLIPIPIIMLAAFLVGHLAEQKNKFDRKDLIILASIIAFGLSIKLTMISLVIIPLVIVKTWRSKLIFVALSVVLFLLFAIPVTLQIERFWQWTTDLFVHSGHYGGGEKNIIDIIAFKESFRRIIGLYKYFAYFIVFQLISLPLFFILSFRKNISSAKIRMAIGVTLAIIVQALITAKHFAPHYFVPAVMLGPLLLLLTIEIIKDFSSSSKYLKFGAGIFLLIFFGWHIKQQLLFVNYSSQGIGNHVESREETRHFIKTLEDESIKIIVSQDYGCPLPEYALLFSTAWAANPLRNHFSEELAKLYPRTYQYTTWDDRFRFWGAPFIPDEIIEKNIPVYIYLQQNNDELYQKTILKIFEENENFVVDKKLLFNNPVNGEGILQLFISKPVVTE